jgi:hypothetical protein
MKSFLFSLLIAVTCYGQADFSTLLLLHNAPVSGGPSPIAWWKLNDGSGATTADDSGNGHTGTRTGTTWDTGFLTFDGTGDYITVANESAFDFDRGNAFSVSAWVRWNVAADGGGLRRIVNKQQNFGNQQGFDIRMDTGNRAIGFVLSDTTGAAISRGSGVNTLSFSVWHHVAYTYDGSSSSAGMKVYVDGVDVSGASSGTISNPILNDTAMLIGDQTTGGSSVWGDMDDVRVYNVELTSGQVSALYSGGAQ